MNDLQIGLTVLGVVLILVVLSFNWWQDRQVRHCMESHFLPAQRDILLGEAYNSNLHFPHVLCREGSMSASFALATGGSNNLCHNLNDAEESDPIIEAIIEVVFDYPVGGANLISYLSSLQHVGRKTIRIFGQTVDQRHHAYLRTSEHYARMQLAVLLVNRDGALTAIEWSKIWTCAQDLSRHFNALVKGPEQHAVLDQANRLDKICVALDMQVCLTLILSCVQAASEVLAIARSMGFVHNGPHLAWMSDEGIARFTLVCPDGATLDIGVGNIAKLNLLLDVPCSPTDDRAFGCMVDIGLALVSRLSAKLVDDQGHPVQANASEPIDVRLRVLYRHLDQSGLRSGSARALRVFS